VQAKTEPRTGHQKSAIEMRSLSANMHQGQRVSAGNRTNHAIKAGYELSSRLLHNTGQILLAMPGRHP